ncbi:MAG TPA: AAA family ATPase [Smithellaceae bacterium]|nr:AAA family ATPase [Smithellaceae bacterium]
MEYYSILNFKKEPFSNSPEPEFFFEAPKHISCLQKLELAVRLRRGLNVVVGGVGTGKTTLCRKLIQQLSVSPKDSQEIETHLLLDPSFDGSIGFLQAISSLIGVKELDGQENEWQLKEKIKNCLFNKGVNENKIVVLIIDEGQKIPDNCIEILREFLNYETNNFKLLQIIIFAQLEFKKVLKKYANLSDRINYLYYMSNLQFQHMRHMIEYRINVARDFAKGPDLFTFWAMVAIYLATRGYPRKVISLCHQVLLMMIIRGKNKADFFLVRNCINDMYYKLFHIMKWAALSAALIITAGIFITYDQNTTINFYKQLSLPQLMSRTKNLFTDPMIRVPAEMTSPASVQAMTAENQQNPPVRIADSPSVNSGSPASPAADYTAPNILTESVKTLTPAPANIPESVIQEIKMPDSLGTLSMKKGRTLWHTINNIYGDVTPEIIEKINKANPHINNVNTIKAGQKINLPPIPVNGSPLPDGGFIVALARGNDIEIMYDLFHENTYKKTLPPLLFFPFWNSREGLTCAVILDRKFSNIQDAKEAIKILPAEVTAKAQIISHWDDKSVFFNRQSLKN